MSPSFLDYLEDDDGDSDSDRPAPPRPSVHGRDVLSGIGSEADAAPPAPPTVSALGWRELTAEDPTGQLGAAWNIVPFDRRERRRVWGNRGKLYVLPHNQITRVPLPEPPSFEILDEARAMVPLRIKTIEIKTMVGRDTLGRVCAEIEWRLPDMSPRGYSIRILPEYLASAADRLLWEAGISYDMYVAIAIFGRQIQFLLDR